MKVYKQLCPLARASEILGERWSILILRGLMYGPQNFNNLRKSMSLISPTILSSRLKSLEQVSVIARRDVQGSVTYALTASGEALQPILVSLGEWGMAHTVMDTEAIDFSHLLWELTSRVDTSLFPEDETIVFGFSIARADLGNFNLVIDNRVARLDMKLTLEPVLQVAADIDDFCRLWYNGTPLEEGMARGQVTIEGEARYIMLLRDSMQMSMFAG
jgi:DNA-binding HxlR family transcriptional regulator